MHIILRKYPSLVLIIAILYIGNALYAANSEPPEKTQTTKNIQLLKAAVVPFTIDSSVKAKITGTAIAAKLEQTLGCKFKLITRSQMEKAMKELQFQNSDLAESSKAKRFGKFSGADYLISGSVIQIGDRITVACQLFKTQTGEIVQTASISSKNINDFNYIIRDAAKVLMMSRQEKLKYLKDKHNFAKQVAEGKKAFAEKKFSQAVQHFKNALESRDDKKIHTLLKIAEAKAAKMKIFNERKIAYTLCMKKAESLLEKHNWEEAEKEYTKAMQVPGYHCDIRARHGLKIAKGKHSALKKQKEATAKFEKIKQLHESFAKNIVQASITPNQKYLKSCDLMKQTIDLILSPKYKFLKNDSRIYILTAEYHLYQYILLFNPHLPKDLIPVKKHTIPSVDNMAEGSIQAYWVRRKFMAELALPDEVMTRKTGIKMNLIPPGKFTCKVKQKELNIPQAFYCGKYEITQKQWKRIMGQNPSHFTDSGSDAPVEQVSWEDCLKFLKKLCELEGVPIGTYRLLNETEWEYACRAGTHSAFCHGDKLDSSMANFDGNYPYNAPVGVKRNKTLPVGSFECNVWGLYDMHGNVWEWCSNLYDQKSNSMERTIKGGSWNISAKDCSSSTRSKYWQGFRFSILGLRIMRVLPEKHIENKK